MRWTTRASANRQREPMGRPPLGALDDDLAGDQAQSGQSLASSFFSLRRAALA